MCWKLIPHGPYQPLHDITFHSPVAALACFRGKAVVDPQAEPSDPARSVRSVAQVVIEALAPFQEASLAVSQAIQDTYPELFE